MGGSAGCHHGAKPLCRDAANTSRRPSLRSGCDIANSRLAGFWRSGRRRRTIGLWRELLLERGRLRKRRASSATSRKSRRPRHSRMTSRRSPCSPVAASVHLPAGPFAELLEPDKHRAARRVVDVADQPVPPLAPAVGEIVAAHRLGLAREAARQFGSIARTSRGLPLTDALRSDSARAPWQGPRRRSRRSARTCAASRR